MKGLRGILINLAAYAMLIMSFASAAQETRSIVIATTASAGGSSGPIFDHIDKQRLADRPGYRAELLLQAGERCGVEIKFLLVPWKRALLLVEYGGADAAYSSSYKSERAVYGAYPMKDGLPDPERAVRGYFYQLFTLKQSDLKWDGEKISGPRTRIAVERGSAGIDIVKRLGLKPLEFNDEQQMLDMLVAKRVDGVVAIGGNVQSVIAFAPLLARQIKILQPALKSKLGYLMFSKNFYFEHTALTECIWNAIGNIRQSADYKALVQSYGVSGSNY
ncbi:substrate-binding periplasmic protein [Agarivorans sp. QJM3NY_29]|uniref:substrate-binding periplasmic protein n=1 Tax=unclassified Agarivorans TaxID=2636026 RepID=UPI003D7E0F8B